MKSKSKKILIIGSNEIFSLENMYLRAFKSLKYNVNFLHTYNIKKNFLEKLFWKYCKFFFFLFVRKKILNILISKRDYYDLIIIFKGLYLNKNFIIKVKKLQKKAKWVNIYPDDPFDMNILKDISNRNVIRTITYFDIFFIWSKKILNKLKNKYPSSKPCYLPFGYDNLYHKKYYKIKKKIYDLSFIGTADKKRYDFLKKLRKFKIILAGNGWNKFELSKNITYVGNANAKKFSKLVNLSHVSLNILRDQNEKSHNMKTFEIPAMGGLLLTKRTYEQNSFFPENKSSLMYQNIFELKNKIFFAKSNNKKILKIKRNSNKNLKKQSYRDRALFIISKTFL